MTKSPTTFAEQETENESIFATSTSSLSFDNDMMNLDPMKFVRQLATSSVLVITPVAITLLFVIISVHIQCIWNYCPHIPIDELLPVFAKTDTHDFNANAANALKNTGVLLSYIIVATFFLLALIYFRLYKILVAFGIFLIIMLCLIIFFLLKSPLLIQQIYLIYISLLVSNFIITLLSPSTAWVLLIFLIIWDLIAVLTPCGPLNLMVKLIKKRQRMNENVYVPPVLIYSTMLYDHMTIFNEQSDSSLLKTPKLIIEKRYQTKHRPNLGLGDFIFYSLLMGQVRQAFTLITVCFAGLSILFGLIGTLAILAWSRRPLPALPISLSIAIIVVIVSGSFIEPFAIYLNSNLIFI
ncbi:signal peptide peptidase-like protein [Euroglyphus maynei]|uniref:Signal peptide peptidase-like protein n=1 Tax=Euroglyphus maynei TaxID=6958 RepID=A0A1Y3AMP9_EURMA|nr:signal peptide peptidase-like protein [Euroglyphus maynei]